MRCRNSKHTQSNIYYKPAILQKYKPHLFHVLKHVCSDQHSFLSLLFVQKITMKKEQFRDILGKYKTAPTNGYFA